MGILTMKPQNYGPILVEKEIKSSEVRFYTFFYQGYLGDSEHSSGKKSQYLTDKIEFGSPRVDINIILMIAPSVIWQTVSTVYICSKSRFR